MDNLGENTITKIISDNVQLPKYDRSKLSAGIFHFGVGNFHRAHQALVMNDLFSQGLAKEFGICGIGVLAQDVKMRNVLKEQSGLYTLVEKDSSGIFSYKVIGSIIEYLFAPDDVDAVIERLTKPEAKIVSLTITEGGYNINPLNGQFDLDLVKEDIQNPYHPKTVFGIVTEALRRRRDRGLNGFTIMSCDNLQENGKVAKRAFCGFAKAIDASLAEWIEKHVSFPSSMVDRITPVTSDEDRIKVSQKLGFVDAWPVCSESFFQWVLEDSFVAGRPPFEMTQVQLVKDVEPYELMKLRLINAGHQAIAYFGLLMNYIFVHDATQNELIMNFLKVYMDREATSTLKAVKGIDLNEYKRKIIERFQNPNVRDTLARLAVDGSDRIPKFVIPVIRDRLRKNEDIRLSVAIVVSFARYLDGKSDSGTKIEIIDRIKPKLEITAQNLQKDSMAIQDETEIFGDIVKDERFLKAFKDIYEKLCNTGSEETLKWLISL